MGATKNNDEFQRLIGAQLRLLRNQAGLSQRGLAQKLDISHQQIQKYERGDNALPLQRVKSFADALGVDPAALAFPDIARSTDEHESRLSPDRHELLRLYDGLPSKESQYHLMTLLRSLEALVKRIA